MILGNNWILFGVGIAVVSLIFYAIDRNPQARSAGKLGAIVGEAIVFVQLYLETPSMVWIVLVCVVAIVILFLPH